MNYNYINENQEFDVIVVSSEQVEVDEVEMDESGLLFTSQQYWLWWAIDHNTGTPLAYCFGTKEHKYLDELRKLLAPFKRG